MNKENTMIRRMKRFFAVLLTACILAGGAGGMAIADSGIVTAEAASNTPSLSISNSGTKVTLSWTKVSGATSYQVYRTTSASYAEKRYGTKIATTTKTSYTDSSSKTSNTPYYYYVVACKGSAKNTTISNVRGYISLTTPSIKNLSPIIKKVTASWSSVKNADKYQLMYSTNKNFTSGNSTASTTSTNYTVSSLKTGQPYYFRVRAQKTLYGKTYYSSWSTMKYSRPN